MNLLRENDEGGAPGGTRAGTAITRAGHRTGASSMDAPVAARAVKREKILLVDDDADLSALRKLRLHAEGYEVREVADGALAMEAISAFRPDLVVLDLLMPNVSGETLLTQIRAEPTYGAVKIIVSSAKSFE